MGEASLHVERTPKGRWQRAGEFLARVLRQGAAKSPTGKAENPDMNAVDEEAYHRSQGIPSYDHTSDVSSLGRTDNLGQQRPNLTLIRGGKGSNVHKLPQPPKPPTPAA